MSMGHYGVETTGLVMTRDELKDLIIKNFKTVDKEYLISDTLEEIDDYDVDEFYGCIDWTTGYYNVDGTLYNYDSWVEKKFFDEDIIVITELEKNNLFEKYIDIAEVKQELKQRYEEVGIMLDDEFIDEHLGRFNGAYWG